MIVSKDAMWALAFVDTADQRGHLSRDPFGIKPLCYRVKDGGVLFASEIKALLRELDKIDFKAHCPHGRPVMQRLALAEVERLFKRQ